MTCPYGNNYFCQNIMTDQVREKMCRGCHLRTFSKNQLLTIHYWSRAFTVLTDGLIVAGYQEDCADKLFVTGIASAGDVVGAARFFSDCPPEMTGRIVHCVTKVTTATFDDGVLEDALNDKAFADNLMRYLFRLYWYGKEEFIRAIFDRDVNNAVRYVIRYCTDHGIYGLTHEQIALICNRARPTVTNALRELTLKEPQLFSR